MPQGQNDLNRHVRADWSKMDLATTVVNRRRALGLTQLDAADLAGVSERFVRTVEAGKVSVQFDKLRALLDTLGLEFVVRVKP